VSKKILSIIIIFFFLFQPIFIEPAFAQAKTIEYLCELGIQYYRMNRLDDALTEFNKALLIDPNNITAQIYINEIFKEEKSREEAIEETLDKLSKKEEAFEKPQEPISEKKDEIGIKIKGHTQISLGLASSDLIWKQANGNLNEEDFRILSDANFNRRSNTFDTRVYDRLSLNLDTPNQEGFNFHTNITIDPWSFIGKSEKTTITGAGGDPAEIELKYWSNTGYTFNETVFTLQNGDSFSLPEIKVDNGKTITPISFSSVNNNTYTIPELKIKRQFLPLRELWFDYQKDGINLRFFPIAYQDQALTTDDPLVLSNNHIWWEESPWLDRWLPGRLNTGATPDDFTKGRFDDSLSFSTRDSDGTRLTALRGFSFEFSPDNDIYLKSTFASPKGLWQDYDSFDNLINSTRAKYRVLDNLSLGLLSTYRAGFNEESKRDIYNYVWGFDLGYEALEGLKFSLEVASSKTFRDLTSSDYRTKSRGNAYYLSLIGAFPGKNLMDLKYGYDEIMPDEFDILFSKYRLYAARMDSGFEPSLSTYRQTRKDTFWSRHIHFRKPFEYYSAGLYNTGLKWEDVRPYRIGNGIDIGRQVIGFRLETSLPEQGLDNLFDVRNVHKSDGKFVENVARGEFSYKVNEKLTTKLLGIYHKLHKTYGGIDPFVFDSDTGIPLNNTAITDAQDPSLKTGSIGLEYAFTEWLALSGIWERTNDYTLGNDNFPRGNLNSTSFTTFTEYGRIFRREDPFLHSQGLFPLPPYPFYNIWKAGLRLEPVDNLDIYLDYTRNEFKSAGQIDDNINHIGFEASYMPTKELAFYFRYAFSRWNDVNRMNSGLSKIYLSHHNFFTELRYLPTSEDEFVLQYGESGRSPIAIVTFDPFGGSLATLDTRHILRLYYRKKF
jgi:hypothetical protein